MDADPEKEEEFNLKGALSVTKKLDGINKAK